MKLNWRVIVPLVVWLVLVLIPVPEGLKQHSWWYFAMFAAVVIGLILEPIPAAAVGLIGVTFAVVMRYVNANAAQSLSWGLSGFSNSVVWLIFAAFVFSIGYGKTGLGRRIALWLVQKLGGNTLGLGYAITLADLVISPGTPSNTARSAGTIYPVIQNIPALYGSAPGETARKIGSYIMWTAFAATCVTSSMFITSMAANPLALTFIKNVAKFDISWTQWFVGFLPIAIVLLILTPLLVYWLYPPEIKSSKEIPVWAAQELAKMGKVTPKEIVMTLLVIVAIFLWIVGSNKDISLPYFGSQFIDATTVALLGVVLMIVTRIVTWEDILINRAAWNILVWFATLVTLADGLNRVGFVSWFAKIASAPLKGFDPILAMALLVALFFFTHYLFASLTAHTTAMLPVVLAVAMAIPGIPLLTFSLLCAYSLGVMGIISPYATGPSPIYYGCGYISRTDFWRLGLIFGIIFLAALLIIGIPYLSMVQL